MSGMRPLNPARSSPPTTMRDKLKTFLKRLLSTIISLAVVATALGGTYYFKNSWFCAALICVLCNLAAVEWFLMLREKKTECNRWLILVGGLVYPWLPACGLISGTTGLVLFILTAFICELLRMDYGKQSAEAALRSVGTTVLAFVYPGWFFSFALHYMEPQLGIPILVTLVVFTKLSDIWAYLCGVLVGRRFISRPFSPAVSPKKSWEGIIGSFLLTILCGGTIIWCVLSKFPTVKAVGFFAFVFVLAVAGDLAGSLVKRGLGVKDSSHILPGIGGIIDLIDSPAFTIAAFTPFLPF